MSLIPVQTGFQLFYDSIELAGLQSYELRLLQQVRRVEQVGHNLPDKLLYGGYSYQLTVRRLLPDTPEAPTWPLARTESPFTMRIRRQRREDTLEGCMLLSLTERCEHNGCAVEEMVCLARTLRSALVSTA